MPCYFPVGDLGACGTGGLGAGCVTVGGFFKLSNNCPRPAAEATKLNESSKIAKSFFIVAPEIIVTH